MRLPASEKLEIIGLVEQSRLPARRTLQMFGIKPSTFYRWYDRFRSGGPEALEEKPSKPDRVWNRIPDDIRQRVVMMAFEQPELSPRELATRFTDINSYYVSESSVYRLLKAHDPIASTAFIVIKAADEFRDKTTAPNQLWQTDFIYLKVIGWGWYYLSTILDDYWLAGARHAHRHPGQIGFVVLVGLAAKNAILIVEFARQKQEEGVASGEAAVHADRTRLRPILMTSFSFILGVAPLVAATGAGAEMRQSLGTAVLFGMLGVTCFGLLLTPAFYTFIRDLGRAQLVE